MAKNNNNNNMLKKRKVTKKEIDEFDLTTHLVNFLWNEPFYSRILRSLNKVETKEIPTAGHPILDEQNSHGFWVLSAQLLVPQILEALGKLRTH